MPEKSWSDVEEYEVEPLARHLTSETRGECSDRLSRFVTREWLIHEDGDIEIAVFTGTSECAAAKKKAEPNAGSLGQGPAKAVDHAVFVVQAHHINGSLPGVSAQKTVLGRPDDTLAVAS